LTEANYSNGDYYHYAYDAAGNRETQQKSILGLVTSDTYVYDDANRLTSLNGVTYTWENNGNLLNDGTNIYTYDSANRLIAVSNQQSAISYSYNGLNDRLRETVNGSTTTFTMDLNSGLTQALSDGTKAYIYGNGRIAQAAGTSTEYFLGDALGSVRQMTQGSGAITYAKAYDPYAIVTATSGSSSMPYGFTGEFTSNNLVYLRARRYAPGAGRFALYQPLFVTRQPTTVTAFARHNCTHPMMPTDSLKPPH
jgi:YD repeat-containing protein